MPDINDLKQERHALVEKMRNLNDRTAREKRQFTPSEQTEWNNLQADVERLQAAIEREDKLRDQRRAEMKGWVVAPGQEGGIGKTASIEDMISQDYALLARLGEDDSKNRHVLERARALCNKDYVDGFWAIARKGERKLGDSIVNSLTVGADSAGGYIVPTEYDRTLVMKKKLFNEIRNVATVMSTSSDIAIPIEIDEGQPSWMTATTATTKPGEEEAYPESDVTLGQLTLEAFKLGRIMKVSEELLQDAFFDLPSYIADAYGRSFGLVEEDAFINGDGVGKPTGILPSATLGHTAAGQTAITSDEIFDLYHSLSRPYRQQARWLTSDVMVKNIRKLKDADGQYLWQPGLQADEPDRILGRPVIISDYVPVPAAGVRSLAFGDMSYYRIADRLGTVMQRLDELYAETGQVGFRMRSRTDGKLTLAEAVKVLVQAA